MTKKERASIIRIVHDIIRADGIIDMREMASLDALRMKYGIERDDEVAACENNLSYALNPTLRLRSHADIESVRITQFYRNWR